MGSDSQSNRILISAPQIPKPDQTAGDKRFVALLAMMAKNYHVDLHVLSEESQSEESQSESGDERYKERYKESRAEYEKGKKEGVAAQTRHYTALLKDQGIHVLPIAKNSFHRAVCKTEYQLCLYEFWPCYFWTAKVLRYFQPWVKIVVDSVDLHFLREESALALGLADADTVTRNKQHELQAYQEADAVVVVSREEAQTLRAYNITQPIFTIPTVHEKTQRSIKKRGNALIFIGGFQHPPNADGLLWFVNEIWPLIVQAAPDVTLTIIGSHPTPEVERLNDQPGIEVLGYVPDTTPYLDRAAISIAPIRFGAGMKGKVTEAMAAGLPIVTTSFGAQGLEVESGEQMMIADDPGLFAVYVLHLLANPELANAMGKKAQEHIASLCGPEIVGRQLDDMLRALIPESISVRSHLEWRIKSALYTIPRLLKPKKL